MLTFDFVIWNSEVLSVLLIGSTGTKQVLPVQKRHSHVPAFERQDQSYIR